MFLTYLPILMIASLAFVFAVVAMVFTRFFRPHNPYSRKLSPWECGMEPIGDASVGNQRVHFFLIAILFIVFDVETLYLFPWAVILTDPSIATLVFVEMLVFILVLSVGLAYAWAKGALDWMK